MPRKTRQREPLDAPQPVSLYAMLASEPHTVGELVDFAAAMPTPWVLPTLLNLLESLRDDYGAANPCPLERRRKLVILGTLVDRLAFEIENVPPRRGASI